MLGSNVRTQVLDDSGTKALATAVDVEAVAAQKADQRLIRSLGQIARQAGWRRNGDQHRNAGLQRLLDDLEGGAPAHHEDVPAEGDQLTIDGVADDLVDCVVTPDILPDGERLAIHREQARRVQASRTGEDALLTTKSRLERINHLRIDDQVVIRQRRVVLGLSRRPLAAGG